MKGLDSIVSVFKTSVTKKRLAGEIRKEIMLKFPVIACNFDLEDCDKILRVESKSVISQEVINIFNEKGLTCEELD